MFEIELYETTDGKEPVAGFIRSLDTKMRGKLDALLEVLMESGPEIREPYSKHLEDGIFELRCIIGSNHARILYFFFAGRHIVLTNGFIKKTDKAPRKEISLAKKRRAEWLNRNV